MTLLAANLTGPAWVFLIFLKPSAPLPSIPGINLFSPLYCQERNPELWPRIDNKRKRGHCSCRGREGDISAPLGCKGKEGSAASAVFTALLLPSVKLRQRPGRGMLSSPSKLEFSRRHGSNLAGRGGELQPCAPEPPCARKQAGSTA